MRGTIVVIDDSLTVRKVAERVLNRAGYSVLSASDGREGLEMLREKDVDLVLLDFMLPDMKGTEVCEQLSQDVTKSEVPIIVLSGRNASDLERDFAEVDAVKACIEKPFDAGLVKSVDAVLGKPAPSAATKAAEIRSAASLPISVSSKPLPQPRSYEATAKAETKTDPVDDIVGEILAVIDKEPALRRVMLRLIVRKHLIHG